MKMDRTKKFHFFEAVTPKPLSLPEKTVKGVLRHQRKKYSFRLEIYRSKQEEIVDNKYYLRLNVNPAASFKWGDTGALEITKPDTVHFLGEVRILGPAVFEYSPQRAARHLTWLKRMSGTLPEALEALAQKKGIKGLREVELSWFFNLKKRQLWPLLEQGEQEGRWKILSHQPLLIYHPQSLEFLEIKIIQRITKFHQQHPDDLGMTSAQLKKKLALPQRVLHYLLRRLLTKGELMQIEDYYFRPQFKPQLTPEEEEILKRMEEIILKGELLSQSLEKIQQETGLSRSKLNMLLTILINRRKIIQSKDGYYLHSQWLEEIIQKLRQSGKKEITVGDFKQMTGLTRKYAIPLLELLDQMGITRRKTPSVREILISPSD
jgi:hypothetical protein